MKGGGPSNPTTGTVTSTQSMQASQAALQTSFKIAQKKAMGKQAMALRHQQQSQNVSIKDVVEGDSRGGNKQQLQLQLLP